MKCQPTFFFVFLLLAVCTTALPSKKGSGNDLENSQKTETLPPSSWKILGGASCTKAYQVALLILTNDGKKAFCGGSLIAPGYVLTAAHCAEAAQSIIMNFGSSNRSAPSQTTNSSAIMIHPQWDKSTLSYDCAVISFPPDSIKMDGANVTTVRLPSDAQMNETFVGSQGTVSGWGLISDYSTRPGDTLQCLNGQIIANQQCGAPYFGAIDSMHICMQGRFQRSTCRGDSGGPLVTNEADGIPTHIGIVSFGPSWGCGWGWPPVFARTTSCRDWILKTTSLPPRAS